jgi:hypothetical protein
MKRTVFVLVLLAIATSAFAQDDQQAIDKALLPAPRQMREGATVIRWKSDFTYDTLKKGTNRLACYERPGPQAFSVECTSIGNLERVSQSLKIETIRDQKERQAAFEAAEKAGTWTKPEFGSVFYSMTGADATQARIHVTISVPGATTKTLGLPESGAQGGAWIMNAGTSAAHIMTPGH